MRTSIRLLALLAGTAWSSTAWAQTPTLEFTTGAGNPTGNGPTTANQVITFQNNNNNPTGNTFVAYTPTTTVTFSLSNQQYTLPTTKIATGTGVSFGGNLNNGGQLAGGLALFPKLNLIGASANGNYSSTSNNVGAGIDVTVNNGTELFVSVEPLPSTVPANSRYQYADLTITFSQAIINPIIDVTGLGGNFGGGIGYTTEFDLLTPNVTLSKLSGSTELSVNATQILNSATVPGGTTGSGAASGSVLATTPAAGVRSLVLRIFLRPDAAGGAIHSTDNSSHVADGSIISISSLAAVPPITGYVFEDVNYGGGAGRPRVGTAGTVARPNARVELYNSAGNYVSTVNTDANGFYSFTPGVGDYTVRVVNGTLVSSRTGGSTGGVVPVQTYNGTTTAVGGVAPEKVDAGNGASGTTLASLNTATTIAESQAPVTVAVGTAAVGADFGYNFDLIVNNNETGQGSFRQFIANSNALGGESTLAQVYTSSTGTTTALATGLETSIFMIPNGSAVAGQAANLVSPFVNGAVTITSGSYNAITGPATAIDGSTQTRSTGDTNPAVTTAGAESTGPEVILNLNGTGPLSISGVNDQLIGLGITGGTGGGQSGVLINSGATGTLIQNNTVYSNRANITFNNNTSGNASAATITGNVIRDSRETNADGIELNGGNSNLTISNNQILRNAGFGIDYIGGVNTGNTITGNTFVGNGTQGGGQQSGIGLRSNGSNNNVISNNSFVNNTGAGIVALPGTTSNVFSQNTFSGNGTNSAAGLGLAIDLMATGATGTNGDGVSLNDNGDADTGANGVLNFPVITSATISNGNLVVKGYARAGSKIELYAAAPDPTGFGEGQTYLGTVTEGGAAGNGNLVADTDTRTNLSYSGQINGLNQGSDNSASGFTFTIPVGTGAGQVNVTTATVLTSTATLTSNTSEFSGNVLLNVAPVANNVTNVALLTSSAAVVLNPGLSATPDGRGTTIASYSAVDLSNLNGTLTYNGAAVTTSTVITDLTKLLYKPTLGYVGNASFTYNATDSNGIPSNTATYTIPVLAVADVVASFPTSNPTAATPNNGLTLTVNFTNAGNNDAAGVTRSVQLPAGLGTVTVSNNGTYNNATGLVSFTPSPTTLTTTGNLNATINIASVPVGMSAITAVATIATTTSENGVTANNTATLTVPVTPTIDLATTITGPSTLTAGTLATYAVTTRNIGPSAAGLPAEGTTPATGAVQTVQLPTNLTNVFATNGGLYNATSGIVTFPDVALASGQLVNNTVTFTVPASTTFAVKATVAPTSAQTGTDNVAANNTAYLNGAAANSTAANTTATAPTGTTPATTADLYVTVSGPSQVAGNSVATYTVTQGNNGPLAANGVQTQVLLPTNLPVNLGLNGTNGTLANGVITFTSGAVNGATYTQATGLLVLPTLTTPQGSAATPQTYTINIQAPTAGPAYTVSASVGATTSDVVAANNVATVQTEVQTVTDVTITLANSSLNAIAANGTVGAPLGNGNLQAGQLATYTVQATNLSTTPARNVQQTVTLPTTVDGSTLRVNGLAGTLTTNANGPVYTFTGGATYTPATGALALPVLPDLMSNAIQNTAISFLTPGTNTAGIISLPVSAAISTSTLESNIGNNAASLSTKVNSAQDVTVSLAGPAQAVIGDAVLYTVSTTNNGPSANGTQTTTVTLPSALDPTTLLVANAASSSNNGSGVYTFLIPGSSTTLATYTASTGVLAFTANGLSLPKLGLSTVNTIQFTAPDVTLLNAVATVTSSGADLNPNNNSAQVITPLSSNYLPSLDLVTSLTSTGTSTVAGSSRTYTVGTTSTTSVNATSVTQTIILPAGLLNNGGTVTTANNAGVYDNATGVVTFALGNVTVGTTAITNSATISLPASPGGSDGSGYVLIATGSTFTTNPETNLANNTVTNNVTVTAKYDLTTTISGPTTAPAGSAVTYTVALTNNGPSQATGVTGTVTLPAGVTSYTLTDNAGNSTTINGSGTVTIRASANLLSGVSELYKVSFTAPTTTFTTTANIANSGGTAETNVAPNTASVTTIVNLAPIANDVVNKVKNPEGNTATSNLALTPLSAADTDGGSIASYTITSIPNATTVGVLRYNGTAVTANQTFAVDASGNPPALTFTPVSTFVGNAVFTYTATDNGNGTAASALTSNPARYLIPVGQDNNSFYGTTPTKGGSNTNVYKTNDVLAYVVDPNGSVYTSAGVVYNAAGGTVSNILLGTSGVASTTLAITGPAASGSYPANPTNTLPAGVSFDPATGLIYVSDATKLVNNKTIQYYQVNVNTLDVNGGINTTTAQFTIGALPLPVQLTAFTATAVANRDAQLAWTTASELNSAYFDVERSLDGITFAKIGQVAAQGNSQTTQKYALTDAGIGTRATSPVYYRLRQVDLDGTAAYSPVRTVSFTKAGAISLYPNPAQASTTLDLSALPAGTYQVLVLDATGRQVRSATVAGGQFQALSLSDLATGAYHVLVTGSLANGEALHQVLRLTKE